MEITDDPEVFGRDHDGRLRVYGAGGDAFPILDQFGMPRMRFRLVYEGSLHATTKARTQGRDKWAVRRAVARQLAGLWATHPTLRGRGLHIPATVGWITPEVRESIDRVREKINEPVIVQDRPFIPLVRKSLALICELDIVFLRNDDPGSILSSSGGDLDNRIKTLFDGLRVPEANEARPPEGDDPEPFFCLLEDDKLISTFTVRTDRLLTDPSRESRSVLLVMEVKVVAERLTAENLAFLTE